MAPILGRESKASLSGYSFSRKALGTTVAIKIWASNRHEASVGARAAFDAIREVENSMSLFREESELCRLNREGSIRRPSVPFLKVLDFALGLSRVSGGKFDPTVQSFWALYHLCSRLGREPRLDEIEKARQAVDWRGVERRGDDVFYRIKGLRMTFNGLAQGYALDRAREGLRSEGIMAAFIDSGEIGGIGTKPGEAGRSWRVGLQHPRDPKALTGAIELGQRCLATSGDYATRFRGLKDRHHLFDPATGASPNSLWSVSVLADSGLEADGLSTALFVLGPERGLELLKSFPRADAYFVRSDGRVVASTGFPEVRVS